MPGIGISIGIANARGASGPPPWTLADLSPGVLVFAHELRGASTIGSVADGARVGSWTDAGPQADALTATSTDRPIYRAAQRGGRPLLEFDVAGVEDRFMAGAVNRTITHLLGVGKFRRPNTSLGIATVPAYFDQYRGFACLNGYDGLYPLGAASVILTGAAGGSTWFDAYSATTYRLDGTAGTPSAADPGLERMAHLWEVSRAGTYSGFPLVVGRDRNITGSAARWRGDARALIGLSSPSSDELAALRSYLAWYRQGTIVAHTGDSLRFGYGVNAFEADSALLDAAYNGTIDCPNFSIPGQGLTTSSGVGTTLLVDDPAKLDGLPSGREAAILVVQVGTNDLAGGRTAAQMVADLWTYCDARRAAGWKVLVFTVIDRTDAAVSGAQVAFDAKRASANALIASGWASHADGLVDVAANALLGANGAANNATYFQAADRVHLTAASYSGIVFPLVQAAVEAFLPL